MKKAKSSKITRRQMLKGSAAMGITAGSALLGFPLVYAKDAIVLRYVASGVNAYQEIADQAKKDRNAKGYRDEEIKIFRSACTDFHYRHPCGS